MGRKESITIVIAVACVLILGFAWVQNHRPSEPITTDYWEVGEWEVEELATEIWYHGKVIPTENGLYILTRCGRDPQTATFDFYPNGSTKGPSSFTIWYQKRFLIGDQLYKLGPVRGDYITIKVMGDPQ